MEHSVSYKTAHFIFHRKSTNYLFDMERAKVSENGILKYSLFDDIAVLILERDFTLQEHINVICLPTSPNFEQFDQSKCVATGWGQPKSYEGMFS